MIQSQIKAEVKQQEKELKKEETKLQSTLNKSSDGKVVTSNATSLSKQGWQAVINWTKYYLSL